MKLLIVGATGLVGHEALDLALSDDRITDVTVLSRRAVTPHPKLTNVVFDFEALTFNEDFFAVDACISALGTTRKLSRTEAEYRRIEVHYPSMIAQAIKKRGGKGFAYVSSAGAKSSSLASYLRIKADAEQELARQQLHSLTIVRPSFILGHRLVERPLEKPFLVAAKILQCFFPKRFRPVTARAIAQCMLSSLIRNQAGTRIIESERIASN